MDTKRNNFGFDLNSAKELLGQTGENYTEVTRLYVSVLDDLIDECRSSISSTAMRPNGDISIASIQDRTQGGTVADIPLTLYKFGDFRAYLAVYADKNGEPGSYIYYFVLPFGIGYCKQDSASHSVNWNNFVFAGININHGATFEAINRNGKYERQLIDLEKFPFDDNFTYENVAIAKTIVNTTYEALSLVYDDIIDQQNDHDAIMISNIFNENTIPKLKLFK